MERNKTIFPLKAFSSIYVLDKGISFSTLLRKQTSFYNNQTQKVWRLYHNFRIALPKIFVYNIICHWNQKTRNNAQFHSYQQFMCCNKARWSSIMTSIEPKPWKANTISCNAQNLVIPSKITYFHISIKCQSHWYFRKLYLTPNTPF